MKKEDLFIAFGNIDDYLIEDSEVLKKNKSNGVVNYKFINYISIAACLVFIVITTTILPSVFISNSEEDISYSNPSLNNSFIGTIDRLDSINGDIVAYITPNIQSGLSEYEKSVEVSLNNQHQFLVGDVVIVYYNEISNINEYIHLASSIIEKK